MFWSINGKIFAGIGVLVTIIAATVKDLTASRGSLIALLLASMAIGAMFALWRSRVSINEVWIAPDSDRRLRLRIRKGDLFDQPQKTSTVTVITMNRRFGLTTPDVEPQALIMQLAGMLGGVETLREQATALPFDSANDQPLGAIYRVSTANGSFALLGMVSLPDGSGEASELPVDDLWRALAHLWQWGREHRADLRIPVIGSGRSGSSLGHELLMALVAISLLAFLRENKQLSWNTEVEMVISEEDWYPERIDQLAHLLSDLKFKRER